MNCSGCLYLCYWNNGEPFCEKDFERICFKTNFLMRKEKPDDVLMRKEKPDDV